jgi:lipoprotein LprG
VRRPLRTGLCLLLCCLTLVAGCTDDQPKDPKAILAAAKQKLDEAETLHFEVTGADLPEQGSYLVSAIGSAKRPDSFSGSFRLALGGLAATVQVVSIDGTLYAKLPLRDTFTKTDPESLGVNDPAELLSPEKGLSSFITAAKQPQNKGQSRAGKEVLTQITATLPASVVGRFLIVANQKGTIQTTFFVESGSSQLRKATFRGPFYDEKTISTYTVTLDRYGEPVEIKAPAR